MDQKRIKVMIDVLSQDICQTTDPVKAIYLACDRKINVNVRHLPLELSHTLSKMCTKSNLAVGRYAVYIYIGENE